MKRVSNIIQSALLSPNVLFYPTNERHTLIDFVYCDEQGLFHAFRATVGNVQHGMKKAQVCNLVAQIKESSKHTKVAVSRISIYYLVRLDKFESFVTNAVENTVKGCEVWHVPICKKGDNYIKNLDDNE